MGKVVRLVLLPAVIVAVTYLVLVIAVNRLAVPQSGPLDVVWSGTATPAGDRITLVTWNLGYGALDAQMDFVADGGTRYLPRSRAAVDENVRGIAGTLAGLDADVFLLQEMARASPLNLGVDVLDGVAPRFAGFSWVFDPEVASRLLPPPLRIAHGTAVFSRVHIARAEKQLITMDGERLGWLLARDYRVLIVRLPIANSQREWVVMNVHLAAFDEAAAIRRRQLADVIAIAGEEYAKGNAVVVGGDWNLEFAKDRFPHKTAMKDRFWLRDFPQAELPKGWTAVFDPAVPSVRTVHRPYEAGVNYVTVIDGYIVSPNVEAEEVRGIDLGFQHSDHQPVRVRLRLRCGWGWWSSVWRVGWGELGTWTSINPLDAHPAR